MVVRPLVIDCHWVHHRKKSASRCQSSILGHDSTCRMLWGSKMSVMPLTNTCTTYIYKHWISIYHQFLSRFCSVHDQMEVSGPSSYASKWPYFCPGNLRWNIKEKTRVPLWLSQAVLSGLQLPLDNKLGTSWDPQNLGLKDVFPSISELAKTLEWYNWRVSLISSLDRCYASGASWSASRRGPQKWWRWLHQLFQHFIHKQWWITLW